MTEKEDFLSFEKALRELKMRSEELKKLVSEGEIRAFRDGDSMKFRREDVVALTAKSQGEEELAFADSLEDDTGMVTEQLSAEDTLLAEDEAEVADKRPRRAGRAAPARAAATAAAEAKEPGWVTGAAIVAFLVLVWGFIISYSVSQETDPAGSSFTSLFAENTSCAAAGRRAAARHFGASPGISPRGRRFPGPRAALYGRVQRWHSAAPGARLPSRSRTTDRPRPHTTGPQALEGVSR
jgi:hypothetical protein